jgi:uncharacterized surface protein with fasciclin (FAS1) repeats
MFTSPQFKESMHRLFTKKMISLTKTKILFLLAIGLQVLLFASCKHDDLAVPLPNENIRPAGDFVKNNYEMKLFYMALKKTGYADKLNETGPFTVLAPTDAAFNAIGINNETDFNKMDVAYLKEIIGYHILPRRLRVGDIPTNGIDVRYATLEGTELYASNASFNRNGGAVDELYFSGAEAERKDVVLANGTLHVLSNVMKPNLSVTVQQWLSAHKEYSVFAAGLKKFGLWDQLESPGTFTIYAPDNAALEMVGITDASLTTMDAGKYLGNLLFGAYILYDRHFFVSDAQVFSLIASNGTFRYPLKGDSHYVSFGGSKAYPSFNLIYGLSLYAGGSVNDPPISGATGNLTAKNDNLCSNGLIHHLVEGLVTPELAIKK